VLGACFCEGEAVADERGGFVAEGLTESFLGGHDENVEFEWKRRCQERRDWEVVFRG
jgi:hypothetical protein